VIIASPTTRSMKKAGVGNVRAMAVLLVIGYILRERGVAVYYIYQYINKYNIVNCFNKFNNKSQTVAKAWQGP
jgi:hypothetical protein